MTALSASVPAAIMRWPLPKPLYDVEGLSLEDVARKAMNIAGDIDVYTNHNLIIEKVTADE